MQINVNDQGAGIPLAEHKRVFEAFRRGVNAENIPAQGAGLGLAICKGLVEAHGGRIWIKRKTLQEQPSPSRSHSYLQVSWRPLRKRSDEVWEIY